MELEKLKTKIFQKQNTNAAHLDYDTRMEIMQKSIDVAILDGKEYLISMIAIEELSELILELSKVTQISDSKIDYLDTFNIDNIISVSEEIVDVKVALAKLLRYIGIGINDVNESTTMDVDFLSIVNYFELMTKDISKYSRGKITEIEDIHTFTYSIMNVIYICNKLISIFKLDKDILLYIEDIKYERQISRDDSYIAEKIQNGDEKFIDKFVPRQINGSAYGYGLRRCLISI